MVYFFNNDQINTKKKLNAHQVVRCDEWTIVAAADQTYLEHPQNIQDFLHDSLLVTKHTHHRVMSYSDKDRKTSTLSSSSFPSCVTSITSS